MRARALWPEDPIFIEIGVSNAHVGLGLGAEGYSKYLGVSGNARRIKNLQAAHPEVANQLVCSKREKLEEYPPGHPLRKRKAYRKEESLV